MGLFQDHVLGLFNEGLCFGFLRLFLGLALLVFGDEEILEVFDYLFVLLH